MPTHFRLSATWRFVVVAALLCPAVTVLALRTAPAYGDPTPSAAAQTHPSQVVLPTGERLALQWSGDVPQIAPLRGDQASILVTSVGTDVYAIPSEAKPYLGSALDRSLFDVTRLVAAEGVSGTGRIPVAVSTTGPGVAVPGVQGVAPQHSRHATGYLTSRSASSFGAALRDRLRRTPGDARRVGTPISGLTRLALAAPGSSSDSVLTPAFPQTSLTVKLVLPADRIVTGAYVIAGNVDDTRKYANGMAVGPENYVKISVPKGHYDFVADVSTANADGTPGPDLFPTVTDYAVTGANQIVTVDATRASAQPAYSTAQPTEFVTEVVDFQPADGKRLPPRPFAFFPSAEDKILVQPTPKSKYGALNFDTSEVRSSAAVDGTPITYRFATDWTAGIPANLSRSVQASQVARVDDYAYANGASGERDFGRGAIFPGLRGAVYVAPIDAAHTIDYLYSGSPDVRWLADMGQASDADYTGLEDMSTALKRYLAGQVYRVNWFRGALPAGLSRTPTAPDLYCVACRTSNGMLLHIPGALDSDPDHSGSVLGAAGYSELRVSQDGTIVAAQADTDYLTLPVPVARHTYQVRYSLDRSKAGFTTSTRVETVYGFRSSATSARPAPADWACSAPGSGACRILPLLTANLPLPVTPAGTIPAGRVSFVVSVGHIAAAAPTAISGLTFGTSVDGTAFRPATVRDLGHGRYRVTVVHSAADVGRSVSVQLHAADTDGSTLTEAVTDAYTIGS